MQKGFVVNTEETLGNPTLLAKARPTRITGVLVFLIITDGYRTVFNLKFDTRGLKK